MEENLTEYEQIKFKSIDSMAMLKWFKIQPDREDREDFIAVLKKYSEAWGLIELAGDETKFRKIYHPRSVEWCLKNGIEI